MPLLACFLAVAALIPFAILLVRVARGLAAALQSPGPGGTGGILFSTACLATVAALDTGLALLVLRFVQLTLHPPVLP